jgi:hypothetical protein
VNEVLGLGLLAAYEDVMDVEYPRSETRFYSDHVLDLLGRNFDGIDQDLQYRSSIGNDHQLWQNSC